MNDVFVVFPDEYEMAYTTGFKPPNGSTVNIVQNRVNPIDEQYLGPWVVQSTTWRTSYDKICCTLWVAR